MEKSTPYIDPITEIHSTFDKAKEFYDKYGGVSIFDDKERLKIGDIAKGNRNLIVGEPGVGKSLLMERIKEHLDLNGYTTTLVGLRQPNVLQAIDEFIAKKDEKPKALLLDALDEVRSNLFPEVIQKIEEVSTKYPDLPIYLSSRWIFISRYATSFPSYRFVTISPFTTGQVQEYLLATGHSEKDIRELQNRVMSFSHQILVIQIPRYLSYLESYLKAKGIDIAAKASRNELFEYFIYKKLELEDKKINADKRAIIKRVLEKLALTMEIYQNNVLTKDELMTFFDELKSDLKQTALAQIDLEVLYECSLLKNNIDRIEFDNTEFQEYLAAREITRLPDPNRVAFGFAVDPDVKEIYPTWFNTLTFLVDMRPDLLEQLIEFAGIRGDKFKVMDKSFLSFLSRVDPRSLPAQLRQELFITMMTYHHRTLQWLPGQLTSSMPGFFDPSCEVKLKSWAEAAEKEKDTAFYVPLGNISYVIAYLLEGGVQLDGPYWRERLIKYACDKNENGVLQRHALLALTRLNDPTVIDDLHDLMSADELVMRELLELCVELDPDHPKSLDRFFAAVRANNFHGRSGLLAMKKPESLKKFLQTFNTDVNFRREFLDDTFTFRDKDHVFGEQIEAVLDDELKELCKEAVVQSLNYHSGRSSERSTFVTGIWRMLRKNNSAFTAEMTKRIKESPDGKMGLYFAEHFFVEVLEVEDVPIFLDTMIATGETNAAFWVMQLLKFSKRENAEALYEAGRSRLSEEYKKWEERLAQPNNSEKDQDERLLREFKLQLEPEPGKFSYSVFDYYNRSKERLDRVISNTEKDQLKELITGTIFKFTDPAKQGLTMTVQHDRSKTFTTTGGMHIFGDAIITAKHLGVNVSTFRQKIIDYIPFAYHDHLAAIFELVKDIKPADLRSVLDVYKKKSSNLWKHQTISFIEAVEKFHVVEAVPILKDFIKESDCDRYAREKALTVVDSLSPDEAFLKEIVDLYKGSSDANEKNVASMATNLLITSHGDADAIQSRLDEVVSRAAAFTRPSGVHSVGDLESELDHGKSFAKPLMDLKYTGYEEKYLKLLDQAMDVWGRGKEFQSYASYLWGIVYSYFDNLKEYRSYEPLRKLEKKIGEISDRNGANWLANRMSGIRCSYLGYLGKPRNISEAIKKYNDARAYDPAKISNSEDLFQYLQGALQTDLRRWIEGEGAYKLILGENVFTGKQQRYEELIQKTLKTQVENILLKRGFQVEVIREPDLLDGKKVDFLVRYGFIGPIVIEVKLTSNKDLKGFKIKQSLSFVSMGRYMEGYIATHGIFLVINNTNAKNLPKIKRIFQKIKNVHVESFDCHQPEKKIKSKKTRRSGTKR